MVVTSDIGDLKDIHPKNKQDVGKRMAAWALSHDYGLPGFPYSGPLPRSARFSADRVILSFKHAESGLVAGEGGLREFEVLDSEGNWVAANARIVENQVEVGSPVADPKGVRYGYRNDSEPTLFNGDGLPASCFEWLSAGK